MSLVVIVPVLGRPHRVDPLCDSIGATTPPCRVLFVADPGDGEEIEAIRRRRLSEGRNIIDTLLFDGGYPQKINAGIRATREPLIFTAADDLDFKPGWFHAARAELLEPVGVVGTQDRGHRLVKAGKHATHFLVSRDYVERHGTIDGPGRLFHDGYHHVCCDLELVETAKSRGAWAFAHDAVVEHLHPHWGKGELDATYRKAYDPANRREDRALLKTRRRLWTASAS